MIEDFDKVDLCVIMDEVRLILAEKNIALSMMRTGIAILVLPLSSLLTSMT